MKTIKDLKDVLDLTEDEVEAFQNVSGSVVSTLERIAKRSYDKGFKKGYDEGFSSAEEDFRNQADK